MAWRRERSLLEFKAMQGYDCIALILTILYCVSGSI